MLRPIIGKALAMMAEQRIATPAVLTMAEKTLRTRKSEIDFFLFGMSQGLHRVSSMSAPKRKNGYSKTVSKITKKMK